MRQIVLDTETTGLEPGEGHRIIELGCVELVSRRRTENHYHQYLQPDREIDPGAVEVHGLTSAFLADKPRFADVAKELLDFLRGAEVIIHNAPFDVGFINHELRLVNRGLGRLEDYCTVTDSLALARERHPGQKNSLDALCRRYGVDNSHREQHGALLDAEILADVYLAMTGGQVSLSLGGDERPSGIRDAHPIRWLAPERPALPVPRASDAELAAHAARLAALDKACGGSCVWSRLQERSDDLRGDDDLSARPR